MDFTVALNNFFASDAGKAAASMLAIAIVDFVLGVSAAIRDGTFSFDAIAAWLRKHVAGRVFPIWVLLFVGHFVTAISFGDLNLLLGGGLLAAVAYIAETVASVLDSLKQIQSPQKASTPDNPVPED